MTISVGDKLPDAMLVKMGEEGPEQISVSTLTEGRNVVLFGLPGAYTGTCTTAHVPSFIRTKDQFMERGVDEIICISVNDPFVMGQWGEDTGATEAGILMVGDPAAEFSKALGLTFSAPAAGLIDRSQRYAMLVMDGEVKVLNIEDSPGTCEASGGEGLLDEM
ncbi:peroxiredoxin [Thalassorhabdomicrobium marinisediminis]|uniref:Glutathione-dependent peroxiredoxin n=1 Tax=Thalassorhabdomicrobium marinisediminis TaxID=2170577 RepID=A0A2T7FVX5_9RHOB|nr:peroxiredoxin [Thalassorhabdomicrobium marinisediminis]PVA06312.1 peroxiredoxin [Thalassorhabdomicrobium marinisediminis]